MDRRTFLVRSATLSAGYMAASQLALADNKSILYTDMMDNKDLYSMFKNPGSQYHPFVRWWWNGNKIEKNEIIRQLHLLKQAGVGGVEINPIAFPTTGDDLGIKSLRWLSDEWIDMLQVAFSEAKKLDMTCDLIVGSGWPFGSEDLKQDERAQVVLILAEELEGPIDYEVSRYHIFNETDPGVTDTEPSRTFEILSLKLAL